jgi:osmotically inducible protein OsmC
MTGSGTLTSQSGALQEQPFSFKTRFESEDGKAGTNPEELIAAAHSGCFSMALAFALGAAGFKPEEIETKAAVDIQPKDGGFAITHILLDLTAKIPGIDNDKFQEIAKNAKANCPVSKALSATPIELVAKLA